MAFLKPAEKSLDQANMERESFEKYRINELSDPRDREDMARILHHLAANGGMKLGNTTNAFEQEMNLMAARYTMAIFEQNNIFLK